MYDPGLEYLIFYFIGLIAFMLFLLLFNNGESKRIWRKVFAVFVIAPISLFLFSGVQQSRNTEKFLKKWEAEKQSDLDAFGKYCKGRVRTIHVRNPQDGGVSVFVRLTKDFPGTVNDYRLFLYLGKKRELCARTGVKTLEGLSDGAYSREKQGYEKEVRRYAMCTGEKWKIVPEVTSRYELVLGQKTQEVTSPWGVQHGSWMSSSSIQLIDRSTGIVLAEDVMYFHRYETGEAGCPEGTEQLANLLLEVFGNQ